ncbi:transcriptional regulator, TetR family [Chitinophaga sp. YR573]|uniref:TetR/AcrR family transcriptional regulator n=1 Tax=Chitinophaga sp. YR573 TaxID=1881040 RepID=UPI0008BB5873|nr:TetR/AcrR family transcriptional regulator [Chitinophaga sp. YR573]SEW43454.1 transcriptional regulator, TetR family [Chitinophaga sp. YR573]
MQDTKERIIELADRLIRTRGFNAFSYKDISDPLEIKNAAVHYYFPSKTDLGIAVINQEIEKLAINKLYWATFPENEQLQFFFDVFYQRSKQGYICLMGSLSPDYETLSAAMQEKVQHMSEDVLEWVTLCLENGRKKQLFHFEGDAYNRALLVVSNMISSLLLARVTGKEVFEKISNQLLKDLL